MPYYNGDPKRDLNFDNYPYVLQYVVNPIEGPSLSLQPPIKPLVEPLSTLLHNRRYGTIQRIKALTWRVGGLSKQVISRVISTLNGILIGVMVLISL